MSSMTTHVGLVKPAEAELADVGVLNSNYDTIDSELYKRGKTVNGIEPDSDGDFKVNEVQFAHEIVSQNAEESSAEYILRTTGGSASINDGDAKVIAILGRSSHTGKVDEVLTLTVVAETREADPQTGEVPPDITASINWETFVAYVNESGTITLTYTNAWSANPALYGVTVSGTPVSGDQIIIVYVKAARGTITNSNPTSFVSTGWNLYNHTNTYARVLKYSATYGFLAGGTYTKLEFSASLTGEKTEITPVAGYFTIPSDGFVWVTGGNSTDTYIVMTWSDWTSGPEGGFAAYTESTINLATVMSTYFPYGMMQVGAYADEINFSMDTIFNRIERISYSAENLAAAEATGRPYDCDENYIYIVKEVATKTENAGLDGHFTANDHGMEYIGGTTVPVFVQTLYGENLVEKLRTDIPNELATHTTEIANLQNEIGIVVNGKQSAVAASIGQYVILKNSTITGKTDGLYTAAKAITANTNIDGTYLTAVSSGGVANSLYDKIVTLTQTEITWNTTNVIGDDNKKYYQKIGKLVIAGLEFTPVSGKIETNNVIASGFPIAKDANLVVTQSNKRQIKLDAQGNLVWWYPTDTSDLSRVDITIVYFSVS